MTIKSSGKLKFSDIENEFGQGLSQYGRKMSNYRRAYDYGDMELPLDTGIPTSGSISFSDFYSKKKNWIVDAYSGSSPVYQINARTDCDVRNIGHKRLGKSSPPSNYSSKKVIIHVNKRIGSVIQEDTSGKNQVAFKTGYWNGADVKLYVGGQGLISGGGGKGGKGGIYARGYAVLPNMKGGDGTSALGIDDTSIEVTVMASNHPLRKSSGTPGAIVAGCGGGGGGAGADRWRWDIQTVQRWDGDYVQVPNPDYPAPEGAPPEPEYINSSTKLLVDKSRVTLIRYWSGGGGGGGGAGLPFGIGGDRGGPTGTIPADAGDWDGRGQYAPSNHWAKVGEDGKSNLTTSNLTNDMSGDGGQFGLGGTGLARGGTGGDGGNYQSGSSSISGSVGGDSQYPNYAGEITARPIGDINVFSSSPSASRFQESGGPGGNAGYAVVCSQSWNNYSSISHDASRVIGTFSLGQPKQG